MWMNISAQPAGVTPLPGKSPYHIKNYKPGEYGGFNQTWQVLQDEQGLIFLASTSAVYTYDGVTWNGIPVKRGAATRQVFYDSTSKVIYVGSVQEFGCLEPDSTGYFEFHSFMDQLKPEESVFTDVWKIHQQGNKIYFQSAEHIFIVENKKVVGRIDPQHGSTFALMFKCGGRLYVRQRGVGLMEISGSTMTLVPNSEMFATTRLMGMIAMDANTNLLLTSDQGFVRMSESKSTSPTFALYPLPNDTFLRESGVLGIEWLNANEFAVCSRYGLMVYRRDCTPKFLFNQKSGMNDESISEFFVDREGNIWIANNGGCCMISYTAPALFFTEENGFDGTLEVMDMAGDTMYLGSSTGFYRSSPISPDDQQLHFERIDIVPNEAWDILITGPNVLVSSSSGVYEINGEAGVHITDRYTNTISWLDTNRVLVSAEKGGFAVLSVDDKRQWKEERYFELPGVELIRMSVPKKTKVPDTYRFTATTRFKSCLIVEFNYKDSTLTYREYGEKNGLPQDDYFPLNLRDSVYLFTMKSTFRYMPALDKNDSSLCFHSAPDIYDPVYKGEVSEIEGTVDYRYFMDLPGNPYTRFFGRTATSLIQKPIILGSLFAGNNIQSGRAQEPSTVWIISQQSVVKYDMNYVFDSSSKYRALITRVRFTGDSTGIYYPANELEISYNRNSVIFNFAVPYFKYNIGSVFRYRLLGYDTTWSVRTRDAEKEYTNLPEGTYTFVVQGANPFGFESAEARFTFTILPPWYRTAWAYCIYVVGFILSVYIAIRISARTLRKQKERLEEIVTERTAEVVEQKHQLEAQKVDLEIAYTGIQDSIQYSQRIQQAILPTPEEIKRIVPESFVLFFPRDIVSGDFYWFAEKGGLKYIACVDCTGHGVPGALMSMIGNTLLNQIILEKNISKPDEILNSLHVGVRHALKQDAGGDTRDGMDLALIIINEQNSSLEYAGAYRALWIIRNGVLNETKADKFPIAGSQPEEVRRFTSRTVPLQKDDVIYLTTDGYADQFGGPRGKKFMVKQLTRMVVDIHMKPMEEQKTILERGYFSWKASHEQVDDVLIIGIRV